MSQILRVPHTLILLLGMMVAALIATWIVPQGFFETTLSESGKQMVVAGTYETVTERTTLTPWDLLTAIPRAFAEAQDVIFFVFIYAMRQAHFKHVALIKEINDRYTVHSISSSDS